MTTITRNEFIADMRSKEIQVSKLPSADRSALRGADVNGDGFIRGDSEMSRAFTRIDRKDRNGSTESVNTNRAPVARAMANVERASRPARGMSGDEGRAGRADRNEAPSGNSGSSGGHLRATVDRVRNRGARNQMTEGSITVNGNTYRYASGGSGRGSLPNGTYKVTRHLDSRSDRTMSVGGVGWSFALNDKFDPRVGATRSLLRIHPDGGNKGTIGCMGIQGDAATQRRFRADMLAELRRNGGSMQLTVG
jgi:hypothetical protein